MATIKKSKTAKIKAVVTDAKKPKINPTRRKAAKAAESAATAREEELAKTLVSKGEFRKLVMRLKSLEVIVDSHEHDLSELKLDVKLQHHDTMWQTIKTFFGRKVW